MAARELQQPENEQDRVLQRLLEGLVPVLPFTDVIDIRLKTEEINALRYAAASGRLWNQQTTEERTKRLAHSYPLEEQGTKSVGAHVFHTQRLHHVFNTNDDPHYHALFPELRQEITVPISLNEQRYGVLTIGTTESIVPLGGYVEDVAKMLGQQLGLYLNLAESVGMIRKSETVQRQAFEDLQHQIKSPLGKAYLRTQRALQTHAGNSESTPDLLALRGLIGKAKQIASSLGLFVQLARGEKLTCRPLELKRDRIYKGISEICEDNRLLYQRTTQTTFELGMNGFEGPDGVSIWIDSDLFLQAANNVIDNAFKYSLPKSVVCVNAHLDQLYFSLVVSSQGLPILCSEVETFKKRGERGSEAKLVTGEGSGLGLWLVDNIMKAHHGRLEIDPTDESGRTIVRLLFPRKRTTA